MKGTHSERFTITVTVSGIMDRLSEDENSISVFITELEYAFKEMVYPLTITIQSVEGERV